VIYAMTKPCPICKQQLYQAKTDGDRALRLRATGLAGIRRQRIRASR
jgi:hypothetical protein